MSFLQTLDAIVRFTAFLRVMLVYNTHLKVYAGGPLNKAVGDSLVAKGVTICTFFGSYVLKS